MRRAGVRPTIDAWRRTALLALGARLTAAKRRTA
jgi:hypothetical protein